MARLTNIKLRRSGTSGNVPTTSQLDLGELAINTYDGKIYLKKNVGGTESIVDIAGGGQSAVYKEYVYTATSNQTTFSGSDDNSQTLSYVADFLQVFLNGVLLEKGTDYTATSLTSVVLVNGASTGDILQVSTFVKVLGLGDIVTNTFTGDGTTAAYTLSANPDNEDNISVFADGVYQEKSTYSVSGTTLTFDANLPNGVTAEVVIGSRNVSIDNVSDLSISGNFSIPDNKKLFLGDSNDLQIYHDASDSIIMDNGTGNLKIQANDLVLKNADATKEYLKATNGGSVRVRHNNTTVFETTSTGIDITGYVYTDGIVHTDDSNTYVKFLPDRIYMDVGGQRRIDLEGSSTKIVNEDTVKLQTGSTITDALVITNNQNVTIPNGSLTVDGTNGAYTIAANGNDFYYGRNGANYHIAGTANGAFNFLTGASSHNRFKIAKNGDISFYEDTGTTAKLTWDASAEDLGFADNSKATFGDGNDGTIHHDGSHFRLRAGTGNFNVQTNDFHITDASNGSVRFSVDHDGATRLYHNANQKLETTSTGIDVTGTVSADALTVDNITLDGNDISTTHSNGNLTISPNGTGNVNIHTDTVAIIAAEGESASLVLAADEADDNADLWRVRGETDSTLTIGNQISGSVVDHITITPNATVTDSVAAFAGKITAAGTVSADGLTVGDDSLSGDLVSFGSTSSSQDILSLYSNTATSGTPLKVYQDNAASTGEAVYIQNDGSGNSLRIQEDANDVFIVKAGGNVGIGTTSPTHALHVAGDIRIDVGNALKLYNSAGNGWAQIAYNNTLDHIEVQRSFQSATDSYYNLGSSGKRWLNTYSDNFVGDTLSIGNITATGYLRGPSTFTIDPAAHGDDTGTVVIAGNLQVDGTTTTINSTTLTVDDKNITLASGSTNKAAANGAGITVDCGSDTDATLTYDGTDNEWDFNTDVKVAGTVTANSGGGNVSLGSHLDLGDNQKARFGASDDLQIYHDGGNSYIKNTTGWLNVPLSQNGMTIANSNFTEILAKFKLNDAVELYHNGNEKLATTSSGIDVTGTVDASDALFNGLIAGRGLIIDTATEGVTDNVAILNAQHSAGILSLKTGGSERMRIGSAGDITQTGGDLLYTGGINWDIKHTVASQNITFYTTPSGGSATERFRIKHDGNVGIGTTDPNAKLDVRRGDTSGKIAEFHQSTGYGIDIGSSQSVAYISSGYNQRLDFKTDPTSGQTERMSILANGKVLIGDTASHTSDLLQIETPASGGGHGIQIRRNDANTDQGIGHILFGNNTATDLVKISAKTDEDSNAGDSGALLFSTQATGGNLTERVRIDSVGNVGIGTASPNDGKLQVYSNSTSDWAGYFYNQNTSGIGLHVETNAHGAEQLLRLSSLNGSGGSNTVKMVVRADGNVGIGTSSPASKLSVGHAGVDTYAVNTSATSAAQVDTFAAATFRTARYTIQITNTTDSTYHVTELLLIHDGTTPSITEYGTIYTGSAAEASFDADIVSGNVRLLATPASSDTMQFKVVRHSILI